MYPFFFLFLMWWTCIGETTIVNSNTKQSMSIKLYNIVMAYVLPCTIFDRWDEMTERQREREREIEWAGGSRHVPRGLGIQLIPLNVCHRNLSWIRRFVTLVQIACSVQYTQWMSRFLYLNEINIVYTSHQKKTDKKNRQKEMQKNRRIKNAGECRKVCFGWARRWVLADPKQE